MQAPNTSSILLEIAGCLGHLESFFATSITKMFVRKTNNSHKSDSSSSRLKRDKVMIDFFEESSSTRIEFLLELTSAKFNVTGVSRRISH